MSLDSFPVKIPTELNAMAFDFGTQRIGAAIGQSVTGTAKALDVLRAKDGIPDWDAIAALLHHWQPDVLVVGLPYNMDGSDSELLRRATKFGNRLHGRFHLPCYGIDERLSSIEAGQTGRAKPDEAIDSIAACIILETWFSELALLKPQQ